MGFCGQYINGISTDCIGSRGGIKEIWISSNHTPFPLHIKDGVITGVTDTSDVGVGNFKQFEFKKGNASMTSTLTVDGDLSYVTTNLQITFSMMDTTKRLEIESLIKAKDLLAIVKDNNHIYWFLGKDYPVNVSASNGQTGSKKSDKNTYSITLSCVSFEYPHQIIDLPWEHQPKPKPPFEWESVVNLYKTYDSNVKDKSKWESVKYDSSYEGGGVYELDTTVRIAYHGRTIGEKFDGWFDGNTGDKITNQEAFYHFLEEDEYNFISKFVKDIEGKVIHFNSAGFPYQNNVEVELYSNEGDNFATAIGNWANYTGSTSLINTIKCPFDGEAIDWVNEATALDREYTYPKGVTNSNNYFKITFKIKGKYYIYVYNSLVGRVNVIEMDAEVGDTYTIVNSSSAIQKVFMFYIIGKLKR